MSAQIAETTAWHRSRDGWHRRERGIGLHVSETLQASVDGGRRRSPRVWQFCDSLSEAQSWCDRWAIVVLREMAADEVAP